jgi:demethylmenaquinone methyltransferase/2-methoxy-6-polyprenyl-1,4-benzoquinol methylase
MADPGQVEGFARDLFDGLADRYDRLGAILSLGQDRRWRKAMVDAAASARPQLVLDVATGPGGVAIALCRAVGSTVVGVDLTSEMLWRASHNIEAAGTRGRIKLVEANAEALPFPDSCFDALTFTYLLRYVSDPAATLRELARVVRRGGVVANLEFHVPPSRFWHAMWWIYTRGVLPVTGYLAGGKEWWRVGRFLGPSISGHYRRYPMEYHLQAWEDAGMADVRVQIMSLGGGVVMWGRKS